MTTYEQAARMAAKLQQEGVSRVQMRYQGWFGGGFSHHTPTQVKLDREVGSRSELQELSAQLQQSGERYSLMWHSSGSIMMTRVLRRLPMRPGM